MLGDSTSLGCAFGVFLISGALLVLLFHDDCMVCSVKQPQATLAQAVAQSELSVVNIPLTIRFECQQACHVNFALILDHLECQRGAPDCTESCCGMNHSPL